MAAPKKTKRTRPLSFSNSSYVKKTERLPRLLGGKTSKQVQAAKKKAAKEAAKETGKVEYAVATVVQARKGGHVVLNYASQPKLRKNPPSALPKDLRIKKRTSSAAIVKR